MILPIFFLTFFGTVLGLGAKIINHVVIQYQNLNTLNSSSGNLGYIDHFEIASILFCLIHIDISQLILLLTLHYIGGGEDSGFPPPSDFEF